MSHPSLSICRKHGSVAYRRIFVDLPHRTAILQDLLFDCMCTCSLCFQVEYPLGCTAQFLHPPHPVRQPGNAMASMNLLHTRPEALLLRAGARRQCRQNAPVGEWQLVHHGFAAASITRHRCVVSALGHPTVALPFPEHPHSSSRVEPDSSRLWTSLGSPAFLLSTGDQFSLPRLHRCHSLFSSRRAIGPCPIHFHRVGLPCYSTAAGLLPRLCYLCHLCEP